MTIGTMASFVFGIAAILLLAFGKHDDTDWRISFMFLLIAIWLK